MKNSRTLYRGIGAAVGLIAPPIALWIYYLLKYSALEFSVFIDRLWYSTMFVPMFSLAVLANLLMFFTFIWLDKDDGSAGVLVSTLLYAFIVFGFKLFT